MKFSKKKLWFLIFFFGIFVNFINSSSRFSSWKNYSSRKISLIWKMANKPSFDDKSYNFTDHCNNCLSSFIWQNKTETPCFRKNSWKKWNKNFLEKLYFHRNFSWDFYRTFYTLFWYIDGFSPSRYSFYK